jgi:beta-N-acetylhexosaminidase
MIGQLHVGGVILYSLQLKSVQQAKSLIDQLQQHSSTPPLISIDEEGCPYIDRLQSLYGCHMNASQIGSSGDIKIARQQGLEVSQDLTSLGINTNLAPDVDVSRQDNPALLDRTFGNTSAEVIKYAGAYLQALQGNGTIGCLKHFPGLGAASTDPHTALAVANISKDQLYKTDLAPFKAFIQASDPLLNPGMIMATDELVPAIDPTYPANLSHTFITDILRNELHYNGVVLSDALYMEGISQKWSLAQATVMALQAGDDLLLGASDFTQASSMIHAIKQAVQSGQLSKARIDEAATRVIALKMQYHLMPANA